MQHVSLETKRYVMRYVKYAVGSHFTCKTILVKK